MHLKIEKVTCKITIIHFKFLMPRNIKENNLSIQSRYRPEIDGLRAFAVVAVIINHFNKEILPNGYLGVDIFFVISGFVITSSLYKRPSKNFKDFISGFYERRVKRLVPALSVFVLITSIMICFFKQHAILSLRTGLTALFGLSNLYLLKQSTNYFAEETQFNVFTQTWSLGVEEQFYILFPFIIWFSGFGKQTKNGVRNLFLTISSLTIASLFGFVHLYSINQPAAYFLMPLRFWEMASGCLLFLGIHKKNFITHLLEKVPPTLVLASIVGIMYLPLSFATASTVAVVILTSILIASLTQKKALYKIFTNPKIIYIGLISYSLYLWHWGILAISRWTIGIHWWSVPIQVLLIIVLAIASYRYIESPFRHGNWFGKRWKTIIVGGGVIITASGGLITLEKSLNKYLYLGRATKNIESPYAGNSITRKNCMDHNEFKKAMEKCWINKENEASSLRRIFFVGDSFNESISQAADYLSKKISDPIFIHSRRGSVFPVVGQYWNNSGGKDMGILGRTKNDMIQSKAENYLRSNIKNGDILVITLRLPYYFGANGFSSKEQNFTYKNNNGEKVSRKDFFEIWQRRIFDLASNLEAKKAKIIISTPTPEWNDYNVNCGNANEWFNKLSKKNCKEKKISFESKYHSIITFLKKLERQNENVYILDNLSALCSNGLCTYTQGNEPLYRDRDHLSNYASRNLIGPILVDLINKI